MILKDIIRNYYFDLLEKDGKDNEENLSYLDEIQTYNNYYCEVKAKITKNIIMEEYRQGLIFPVLRGYEDTLKKSKNKNKVQDTHFITLNFKELDEDTKVHLPEYMKEQLNKCKYILDYRFCIEQRGNNTDSVGVGIHSHIIMTTSPDCRPASIRKSLYKLYKNEMSDMQKIDTKKIKTSSDLKRIENYIRGIKKDQKKIEKVKIDVLMRKKYKYEDIYYKKE